MAEEIRSLLKTSEELRDKYRAHKLSAKTKDERHKHSVEAAACSIRIEALKDALSIAEKHEGAI